MSVLIATGGLFSLALTFLYPPLLPPGLFLKDLPHEYVPPDMLQKVADHGATNKIYACEVSRRDHLIRIKGGPFDAKEYDEYPSRYISVFSKKVKSTPTVPVFQQQQLKCTPLRFLLDCSLRFGYNQRNLLGAQLAKAHHHSGCQSTHPLGSESPSLGADVTRLTTSAPSASCHLRHQ
jgi:hypothetical protein